MLAAGWIFGGPSGLYCMLIVTGIIAAIIGPGQRVSPSSDLGVYEAQERLYERIDHARRGSHVDPTRPGYDDDHPLLLTNEFRRTR